MKFFLTVFLVISGFAPSGISGQSAPKALATSECTGGILNGKALNMPVPLFPRDKTSHIKASTIIVWVSTNERGYVIQTKSCSGPEELMPYAEDAAKKVVLSPTMLSEVPIGISGKLVYRFDPQTSYELPYDFGCGPARSQGSSILNGYAIELAKPVRSAEADRLKQYGSSSAVVLIGEDGKFESVEAVSGHEVFRQPVIDAVKRSRFRRFLRCGKPLKVSGVITFNFPRP